MIANLDADLERLKAEALARTDLPTLIQSDGIALQVKRGEHRGLCPFHDDHNPSLSVFEREGRQRFHCFSCGASGDAIDWITKRQGKTYPEALRILAGAPPLTLQAKQQRVKVKAKPKARHPTARKAAEAIEWGFGQQASRAGWWQYLDATGEPVSVVLRFNRSDGGKDYPAISRCDDGQWICAARERDRPLYRLPQLLEAQQGRWVFVCEGEKSADAAAACGLLATTSQGGSNAPRLTDWGSLAARRVCILPDRDTAGEAYANTVAGLLRSAGVAEVRVVRLQRLWPDLPKGGDIADLLEHRGDAEAEALGAAITELAESVEPIAIASGGAAGEPEDEPADEPDDEPEALAADPEPPEPTGQDLKAAAPAAAAEPSTEEPRERPEPLRLFPVDALPQPLARYVAECAEAIGCDASMIATPLLSALAAAVGNSRCVELKPDHTEPAIVWTAVVCESGSAKSPAMRAALRFLQDHERQLREDHSAHVASHREAEREHKRQVEEWRAAKKMGQKPPEPEPLPKASRILTADPTVESLADTLQHNPRGLLLARDELAGWFGGLDQYRSGKGGDAQKFLEAWAAEQWIIDRKQAASAFVPRVSISITGGIQPAILRRLLEDPRAQHRDSGLAARFLFTRPAPRVLLWSDRSVSQSAREAVAQVFQRLLALEPTIDRKGRSAPERVAIDPQALEWFKGCHDAIAREQEDLSGYLAGAWSKLKAYLARLSLLFHLVREAAGDPSLRPMIDARSVQAAARVVDYFGSEAKRLDQEGESTEGFPEAERILLDIERLCLQHGGRITPRHLYDRWPGRYRPMQAARQALRYAEQANLGRIEKQPTTGGRTREVFAFTAWDDAGGAGGTGGLSSPGEVESPAEAILRAAGASREAL